VQAELEELKLNTADLPLNPLLNIDEFEDCYKISFIIPGVSREDIFIDIQNNLLSIMVLHKEREERRKKLNIHEFEGKYFERHIILPDNADPIFVSAEYKAGILHICIPKSKNPMTAFSSRIVTY
jgi:HSP20 family protein